jgi:hypothetical protein
MEVKDWFLAMLQICPGPAQPGHPFSSIDLQFTTDRFDGVKDLLT